MANTFDFMDSYPGVSRPREDTLRCESPREETTGPEQSSWGPSGLHGAGGFLGDAVRGALVPAAPELGGRSGVCASFRASARRPHRNTLSL